ncbi:MAG: cysteine desulfurase [Treponema sp.]|nr:cysteine desulfurase [Treponema sp.]
MTSQNDNTLHYFDWAATTPPDSDIIQEALQQSLEAWGNPSSIHSVGTKAKDMLSKARKLCAQTLEVDKDTLYFTSGGTESDHIPLLSLLTRPSAGTILVSSQEHAAIREQAAILSNLGWNIVLIPTDQNGFITKEAVLSRITQDTMMVCIMAVNNETGAIQPIYEIADALIEHSKGKRKPKLHIDCVQAAGKIPLHVSHNGIDSAAFSAHKICGPRGIGLLYTRDTITPFLRGGGQEKNIRSGTENVLGAIALSKCMERYCITKSNTTAQVRFTQQKEYTNSFLAQLQTLKNCMIIPAGRTAEKMQDYYSPWIVQAAFKGIPGQVMVRALDSKGFYISTGSACSAKKKSRPILEAMHIPSDLQETAVRFSFGPHTTQAAMQDLFTAVKSICDTFTK